MAPTPVMSSSTPILIGLRVGGAAAEPGLGALAGAVAVGAAGAQAAASPQAHRTISTAATCRRGFPDDGATDLMFLLQLPSVAVTRRKRPALRRHAYGSDRFQLLRGTRRRGRFFQAEPLI